MKTCPKPTQTGSALVLAIFVLTVMMLLGTVLVRSLTQQTQQTGLETYGIRAWAAAQSGIDFGLANALNMGNCPSRVDLTEANSLPEVASFHLCEIAVMCIETTINNDTVNRRYQINAAASCGPDSLRSSRTIEAMAYD